MMLDVGKMLAYLVDKDFGLPHPERYPSPMLRLERLLTLIRILGMFGL